MIEAWQIRENHKRWLNDHPGYMKAWRINNKDRVAEHTKRWRVSLTEEQREAQREARRRLYRLKHPPKPKLSEEEKALRTKESTRRWCEANPEKYKEIRKRAYAKKRAALGLLPRPPRKPPKPKLTSEERLARSITNLKHGHARVRGLTITYCSWQCMKKRCLDPKHRNYSRYGGANVSICDSWMTFSNFLADMGERPSRAHTLSRHNDQGNYEPGNVSWEIQQ